MSCHPAWWLFPGGEGGTSIPKRFWWKQNQSWTHQFFLVNIPVVTGFHTCQVVLWDFFHQQDSLSSKFHHRWIDRCLEGSLCYYIHLALILLPPNMSMLPRTFFFASSGSESKRKFVVIVGHLLVTSVFGASPRLPWLTLHFIQPEVFRNVKASNGYVGWKFEQYV